MFIVKLYVTGRTPTADRLIARVREMFEENCRGQYELEVIDVFDAPGIAYDDLVLATPTLIKALPPPVRRIVGDLSDSERVLAALELVETN